MKKKRAVIMLAAVLLSVLLISFLPAAAIIPANKVFKYDTGKDPDGAERKENPGNYVLKPGEYMVKNGDTLENIAYKHGISVTGLKWANPGCEAVPAPGLVLSIPSEHAKPLKEVMADRGLDNSNMHISIVVDKSDHILGIFSQDVFLESYHVELGDSGLGDKEVEGDHKTPEGKFYISEKSVLNPPDPYLGSRWLRISYPNIEDADRGLKKSLIGQKTHDEIINAFNNKITTPQFTPLGGGVGIHGGSSPELGRDWTWGCVGLKNTDIEDFFDYIDIGTSLLIQG